MQFKVCPTCGESFSAKPSELARRVYCSRPCQFRTRTRTCPECGQTFQVKASHFDLRVYCSLACAHVPRPITRIRTCPQCGTEFEVHGGSANPSRGPRFCSRRCGYLARSPRGLRWFMARVQCDVKTHCWIWIGARDRHGYGLITKGPHRMDILDRTAHRAAYRLLVGPIPSGLNVLHKCDRPACVRPDHLYVDTQKRNVEDMVLRGRTSSKLTPDLVRAIRTAHKNGDGYGILARRYKLGRSQIARIIRYESWRHVD